MDKLGVRARGFSLTREAAQPRASSTQGTPLTPIGCRVERKERSSHMTRPGSSADGDG